MITKLKVPNKYMLKKNLKGFVRVMDMIQWRVALDKRLWTSEVDVISWKLLEDGTEESLIEVNWNRIELDMN